MEPTMRKRLDLPANADPLDFLEAAFRSDDFPMKMRLEAAAAAAPCVHPVPAPIADLGIKPHERVIVIPPKELPALPTPA
jgi:hypothetical protein